MIMKQIKKIIVFLLGEKYWFVIHKYVKFVHAVRRKIEVMRGIMPYVKVEKHGMPVKCYQNDTENGFSLCTNLMNDKQMVIYDFGIGEDLSFDELILKDFPNADIYAFDPTPRAKLYVRNSVIYENSNFHFFPWGISYEDGMAEFYIPPEESLEPSGSIVKHNAQMRKITVLMKTISTIMDDLGHKEIDILKLDIEGLEFSVIPQIMEMGCKPRQICIEFHCIIYEDGKRKMEDSLKVLSQNGYFIAAISTSGHELLFVRN